MCFTGLFVHGVLPPSMISVVFVPIVKNKRINICSKNNYRPIALASIMQDSTLTFSVRGVAPLIFKI